MKRSLFTYLSVGIMAGTAFLISCKDDEDFAAPTLTLSETAATASPGDEVSVTVTTTTDAGFKNLVVKKLWDGVSQEEETFTAPLTAPYTYTVTDADADHILVLNFTVTDNKGTTASSELVVTVELTPRQLLLKYNWRLSEEIRKKTNQNDISDVYTDDVYRFNDDGTYDKSIGAKVDDFGDIWYNYCYYDLNDNTLKLLMSRTGAFGEKVTDTLNIKVIDDTKLHADVTYYGLDQFDPAYDPAEDYEKRFVAVAKTSAFDPYKAGAADDETGPAGYCEDVTFEND
ncbi:MAG: hypothetical protein WA874_20015 [Chryseosolibacter sp.]